MTAKTRLFVAETNERGQVVWVWRYDEDQGVAHPIHDALTQLTGLEKSRVEFSGAPSAEIIKWLQTSAKSTTAH